MYFDCLKNKRSFHEQKYAISYTCSYTCNTIKFRKEIIIQMINGATTKNPNDNNKEEKRQSNAKRDISIRKSSFVSNT